MRLCLSNTRSHDAVAPSTQKMARDPTGNHVWSRPLEALEVEYREMAAWYDSFWASYLNQTLERPLNRVLSYLEKIQANNTGESPSNQEESILNSGNLPSSQHYRRGIDISVLDLGCGTGEWLYRLHCRIHGEQVETARRTRGPYQMKFSLYGVEPSTEMLREARKKFEDMSTAEKELSSPIAVQFLQSTAEQIPVDDNSIEILVSTNSFHFFRDKQRAVQEIHRVVKANGIVVVTDWCADYWIVKLYHHIIERFRWIRFPHKYPGPLSTKELCDVFTSFSGGNHSLDTVNDSQGPSKAEGNGGFEIMEVKKYRIRFWALVFWGMQTLVLRKR